MPPARVTHMSPRQRSSTFFFFNDTATTEIYTLSLHDALPISSENEKAFEPSRRSLRHCGLRSRSLLGGQYARRVAAATRSEEHTSELQSPCNLVCRLLLEKKKDKAYDIQSYLSDVAGAAPILV